jgi:predicted ABC-type ATPase
VSKIAARYHRSLELLPSAISFADRGFLFDTSESEAWYFAETSNGTQIELKSDEMPNWFQPVWDQF